MPMKIFISAFLFLFIFFNSYSQPKSNDNIKKKVEALEVITKKSIRTNDSLINTTRELRKELDYKKELLEDYNKLNSITFNVISGLFAFFGIIVPLLGYFFVVVPTKEKAKEAQELLDSIKNNLSDLFEKHINENRIALMDNAIKDFEVSNTTGVSSSYLYIQTHMHEGYTDSQVLRALKLIKKNHPQSGLLLQSLIFTDSVFIEDYFSDFLVNRDKAIAAIAYMAKYNKQEYINDIVTYLIDEHGRLIYDLIIIARESPDFAFRIINDEKLVNDIHEKSMYNTVGYFFSSEKDIAKSMNLENSKMNKKYIELHQYLVDNKLNHSHLPRK
jgi:AraC-like DNA-binding protein